MAEVDEQRVCINFCVRLGKTGSETFEMLKQAFGDSCMNRSRTFGGFGPFKNGKTSTANDDRSGRPSTATNPVTFKVSKLLFTSTVLELLDTSFYFQRDATLHSLFMENCSTCFGWYLHPSSGARITVFTVSGACYL